MTIRTLLINAKLMSYDYSNDVIPVKAGIDPSVSPLSKGGIEGGFGFRVKHGMT